MAEPAQTLLDSEEIASSSHSYTAPAGYDRLMVVVTCHDQSDTSSATATWDGNSLTSLSDLHAATPDRSLRISYYYLGTATSGETATIALTGTWDRAAVYVWQGINQSAGFGTPVTNTSLNEGTDLTVTPAVSGSVILYAFMRNDSLGGTMSLSGATSIIELAEQCQNGYETSSDTSNKAAQFSDTLGGTTTGIGFGVEIYLTPNVTVSGTVGTVTLTGNSGSVTAGATILGTTGTLTLTGNDGTVSAQDSKWKNPDKSDTNPTITNVDKS